MDFLLYLIAGSAAGIISGMFGVGGGIIIVPILSFLFTSLNFPQAHLMHLAIGTSLATVVVNSISSSWGHHRRRNIDWQLVKSTLATCIIGVLLGTWLAASLASNGLKMLFAGFECLVAIKLFMESQKIEIVESPLSLTGTSAWLFGGVVGIISSLLGIGGGTVSVPIMLYLRMATRRAIGTAAAIGLPISLAGVAGYIFIGWSAPNLPDHSLGFVYLPAFLGIAVASIFTVPLGVSLAHKLPINTLKKLLAALLFLLGVKMGWSLLS